MAKLEPAITLATNVAAINFFIGIDLIMIPPMWRSANIAKASNANKANKFDLARIAGEVFAAFGHLTFIYLNEINAAESFSHQDGRHRVPRKAMSIS